MIVVSGQCEEQDEDEQESAKVMFPALVLRSVQVIVYRAPLLSERLRKAYALHLTFPGLEGQVNSDAGSASISVLVDGEGVTPVS